MENLALHLLDVAENALAAGAARVDVRVSEAPAEDVLTIEIEDDGRGVEEQTISRLLDPFHTTKPGKKVGLGLALFAQAAREAGGNAEVHSELGSGTTVRATFRLSHPDLKPLGEVHETLAMLACAHPQVRFVLEHHVDGAMITQWDSGSAEPTGR